MNLNLDGLTNIHLVDEEPVEQQSAPPAPESGEPVHARKVTRSPNEELLARVEVHGAPQPIPDELAAILAAHKGEAKVEANGLTIQIDGQQYRYWHADSITCLHNVGQKVLYVRARSFLDCIHILDEHGRYSETLPLSKTPDWFTAEAKKELKETRRVIDHIHEELQKNHATTTTRKAANARETREKLVACFEMDVPGLREARTNQPTHPRFEQAAEISDVMRDTRALADDSKTRTKRSRSVDMVDILNRRAAREVHAE